MGINGNSHYNEPRIVTGYLKRWQIIKSIASFQIYEQL